ncbi:MAG: class I SAM-dependent rRNA methyltransferase [Thermoguttaceae bacterium]|jgi:23S rRNA (cytosine1962-C5)-methyltransferase
MALSLVVLKPRRARPALGRHPWVLDSAIARIEGHPADGDVVDVLSARGEFIARGIFNARSRIHVRLYTWDAGQPLDEAFWRCRLERALRLRTELGYGEREGAARLVFSEGDSLGGLVVDRYADVLVLQVTALAMAVRLGQIVPLLAELARPRAILARSERDVCRAEGIEPPEPLVWGPAPDPTVVIREAGLLYAVDLAEGQKTGFYLDQRENRRVAAGYLAGRTVLDTFCYTGGFGLSAARGGAQDVLGVESSEKALALARQNARRNGLDRVRFERGEAFATLQALLAEGRRFGGVVLDPPRFARNRAGVEEALRAYRRLNALAMQLVEPDGMLVTCSCSGHVGREDFLRMLQGAAQQARRDVQVLDQRGAAPDHPVAVACPETEYLKCSVCRVA